MPSIRLHSDRIAKSLKPTKEKHVSPHHMKAVKLVGHGGIDQLVWDDAFPLRSPGSDEVVVKVGAAGVNNTDINTRIGWYSKKVDGDTESGGAAGFGDTDLDDDASWSGVPLQFPRIQCGRCRNHRCRWRAR